MRDTDQCTVSEEAQRESGEVRERRRRRGGRKGVREEGRKGGGDRGQGFIQDFWLGELGGPLKPCLPDLTPAK